MTSSLRARPAIGIAALLLTPMLVGCNDDEEPPEPMESPTTSESMSTPSQGTATPTGPVTPTLPAEAEEATRRGAEAFIDFYWSVVSYALVSGDVGSLEALAGPECAGCKGGADFIHRVYRKGGSIEAEPYEVLLTKTTDLSTDGASIFECDVRTKSSRQVITIPGERTQRVEPVVEEFQFTLLFNDGAWRVDLLEEA